MTSEMINESHNIKYPLGTGERVPQTRVLIRQRVVETAVRRDGGALVGIWVTGKWCTIIASSWTVPHEENYL